MGGSRSVAWILGACLTSSVVAEQADAQCWIDSSTCTSSYCNIYCPTTSDYIVFGKVCWFTYCYWGVCQFESDGSWHKGAYVTAATTGTVSADYRVFADGGGPGGGNDVVRLAKPSGESCGPSFTIYGVLPSANTTYYFRGDGGADHIHVGYAAGDPPYEACASQTAPVNTGRADGRAGNDHVVGTSRGEELWGQDNNDWIWGCGGADTLHGGNHDDTLIGGGGSDVLYGDSGADDLFGENYGEVADGAYDTIWGGSGDDDLYDPSGDGKYYGELGCDFFHVDWTSDTTCDCGSDLDFSGTIFAALDRCFCSAIINCTDNCREASGQCASESASAGTGQTASSELASDGNGVTDAETACWPRDPDAGACTSEEPGW